MSREPQQSMGDPASLWHVAAAAVRAHCDTVSHDAPTHLPLLYLGAALQERDAEILTRFATWAASHGQAEALRTAVAEAERIIAATLPPAQAARVRCFLAVAGAPRTEPSSDAPADPEHAVLADRYLAHLLAGDRRAAVDLALGAVDRGMSVADLYLYVLQPALRRMGDLWAEGRASIAQEHFGTALTQLVMAQLYPRIARGARRERRLLAACTGAEQHEVGLRMVADFFEMAGWDVHFLGADSPPEAVLAAAAKHRPHLIALSATLDSHVPLLAGLIGALRAAGVESCPRILVGGRPFIIDSELWRAVGADGGAIGAAEAVAVGEALAERAGCDG